MARGKTKWKQKKNNENELIVNCYRMPSSGNYVISFVFTVKLNLLKFQVIILIVLWIVVFVCKKLYTQTKKMGVRQKNMEKWEKCHDSKKILKSVFRQPGNPCFCF